MSAASPFPSRGATLALGTLGAHLPLPHHAAAWHAAQDAGAPDAPVSPTPLRLMLTGAAVGAALGAGGVRLLGAALGC